MADKLKEIPAKILEWWNKFTSKQKTIIIAITAVVIFTFAIIIYVFSRPQYVTIGTYENRSVSAEVIDILNDAGIEHKESSDSLTIQVEASQQSQAEYAMGAAGFVPDTLKLDDYLKSGMSTTSSDKEKQYVVYLNKYLERMFMAQEPVESVIVSVSIPDQDGTLGAEEEEATAYIQLTHDGTFTSGNASAMAKAAATFLRKSSTEGITIVDQNGDLVFAGSDNYSVSGIAGSLQELQDQAETVMEAKVKQALLGTNQYNRIEVAGHLVVDYRNYEETVKEYYANSDRDEGMFATQETFETQSTNGVEGVPGTDSNGDDLTGYVNPDYANSESSTTEQRINYLPNERSQYSTLAAGSIDYDNSSMSISMISFKEYKEELVDSQGLLDGITWEEFKAQNGDDVRKEVEPEFYAMAANATGISQDKITILAYEHPVFIDKEGLNIEASDILSIVMIVLILALLAFVVLRSMVSRKDTTEEEELSVESMLQSTQEVIEDIDVETKSETRKMIEKFVDENPEAVANLLRNWLNEDWG